MIHSLKWKFLFYNIKELRKWTFCIIRQLLCPNCKVNRLYKSTQTYPFKFGSVKAYWSKVSLPEASQQTSFGVHSSRIHFSPTDRGAEMNVWLTNPKGRLREVYTSGWRAWLKKSLLALLVFFKLLQLGQSVDEFLNKMKNTIKCYISVDGLVLLPVNASE